MVDCPPIGVEYQRMSRGGARHARETVIPRGYAKGIHSGASERVVRLLNGLRRGPLQGAFSCPRTRIRRPVDSRFFDSLRKVCNQCNLIAQNRGNDSAYSEGWQVLSGETGLGICKETPVERWARRVGVEREGERAEDMLFAPRNVFFREIKSVSSSLSVLSASLFLISIRGGMLHAPPHQ